MDVVEKTFDIWAQNGRADIMEVEHGKYVSKSNHILISQRITQLIIPRKRKYKNFTEQNHLFFLAFHITLCRILFQEFLRYKDHRLPG